MAIKYPFPFSFRILSDEELEILRSIRPDSTKKGSLKLIETPAICASHIIEMGEIFCNFKPRPDDIWLIGFIRSGTTLTQEILYLLGTDLNYEKAASQIMDIRFPVIDSALRAPPPSNLNYENAGLEEKSSFWSIKYLDELQKKRFIKSHYGFNYLHPEILEIGCKVIFVARNPKDVMASISRYPSFGKLGNCNFQNVWNIWKNGLCYCNYFGMLESVWKHRDNKHLLIIFYEHVNDDKKGALLKIADFLGRKLTENDLEKLLKHLHIDSFKDNKSLNNDHLVDRGLYAKNNEFSFIRKGKNGGWKDVIPEELVAEIDEWVKENLAKIRDFEIPEIWKTAMEF